MQRLTLVLLPLMILALASPAMALAQDKGTIELKSIAEVEIEDFNAEGQKVVKRVPAAKVVPGSEVIYTNLYTNVGSEAAAKVVITNPIPATHAVPARQCPGCRYGDYLFHRRRPNLRCARSPDGGPSRRDQAPGHPHGLHPHPLGAPESPGCR